MTPCHDIAVIKSLQQIFVGKKKLKNVSEFYQFSCFLTPVFQVKIWFQVESLFKNLPKLQYSILETTMSSFGTIY